MNLTARQAAERLNVPHPHLLILLSEGEIPSRKIGRHRFVREEDLLDYKAKRDAERRRILDKMVRDAEEAGLYGERGRLLTACEGTGKEFTPVFPHAVKPEGDLPDSDTGQLDPRRLVALPDSPLPTLF